MLTIEVDLNVLPSYTFYNYILNNIFLIPLIHITEINECIRNHKMKKGNKY